MANAKPFGPFKLPGNPQELIDFLEGRYDMLHRERAPADFRSRVNLAFYHSHQWLIANVGTAAGPTLTAAAHNAEDPESRTQLTINKIGSHVDRIIAKLTKANPIPECRPVSAEEKDKAGARVGTRILASEAHRLGLEQILPELYSWVVPCGWAYLSINWDPQDGPVIHSDDEGNVHLGNVKVEIVPHFEIVLNPGAKSMLDARWCIRTIALTQDEIYERWGVEVVDGSSVRTVADEMNNLATRFTTHGEMEKYAVRQFWLKKDGARTRPEGMVFSWVGRTVLDAPVDYPYEHNHLPFAQFNFLPPQGGPWGRTTISDLVEIQMDYNHSRSRMADIRDRLLPKLIAPEGSVDVDMIRPVVEAITYKPIGAAPTYQDVPLNWMQMFNDAMARADAEMADRTGMTEAAKGALAGTSPAATVLAQQEAAAEPLGLPIKELAKGLSEYGWQHLMLVKQFWEEKRVVRTWSESGQLEVKRFAKADLKTELDVHVTPESALPRSKAGRAQLFLELWGAGVITDPRTLIQGLELPPTDVLARTFDEDVAQAERENDMMTRAKMVQNAVDTLDDDGQPIMDDFGPLQETEDDIEGVPQVEDWHNHTVHIAVHNSFRKTEEFDTFSEVVQAAFEAHVATHQGIVATQQQQMMGPEPEIPEGPGDGMGQPPGSTLVEPPDPDRIAAGLQAPPKPPTISRLAQIGGREGRPGRIPGVSADDQAASMGE